MAAWYYGSRSVPWCILLLDVLVPPARGELPNRPVLFRGHDRWSVWWFARPFDQPDARRRWTRRMEMDLYSRGYSHFRRRGGFLLVAV